MTSESFTAVAWLQTLAARGVSVTLRNNRVWLHPANAFSDLSDNELLFLRHHRASIKEAIRAGVWSSLTRSDDDVCSGRNPTVAFDTTSAQTAVPSEQPESVPPNKTDPSMWALHPPTLDEWRAREARPRLESPRLPDSTIFGNKGE